MRTSPYPTLLLLAALTAPVAGQIELPAPLSGVYKVSPTATDKRTFKDVATAVRYISLVGVKGDFRLEVHPGNYAGELNFFPVPGLEEGKQIVIQKVGNGEAVLSHDGVLVRLNEGVRDIVFDGLVFGDTGSESTILAGAGCTDIEIRNCRFTPETGANRVIEIQGRNGARRWKIHGNKFQFGSGVQYGIYTQATYQLHIYDNDFDCGGCREPISLWNANQSESSVHGNVFRGRVGYCCIRLDVSGHDVDVYDNLFLLQFDGGRNAVIRSQGLRGRAYNKIRHNVFVVRGPGVAVQTAGPIALNHNLYALESGTVGSVNNNAQESLKDWQEALAELAENEQADQGSATAQRGFFDKHRRLLDLLHRFEDDQAAAGDAGEAPPAQLPKPPPAMTPPEEIRFLIDCMGADDPVVVRLALHRLLSHGRKAIPAVPVLGRLCGHPHAGIRAAAVNALGRIRIGAEIVIPELVKLLDDKDEMVLLATIRTLGSFQHLATEAAPRLQALERHESAAVKTAAAAARRAILGEKEPPKTGPDR